MIRNPNDPTDDAAMGPSGPIVVLQSQTEYHRPGLPKPPAGWGKVIGFIDSVDGDDEGPEAPDEKG